MGQNNIKFVLGEGGLGRVLPKETHISGLVFGKTYAEAPAPTIPFVGGKKIINLADAVTQGITEALYPVEYVQIEDFFTINPLAELYVIFETAEDDAFTYAGITTLQNLSGGKIRQFGVLVDSAFDIDELTKINVILNTLFDESKPAIAIYGADFSAATLSTLPDLRAKTFNHISVVLSSDEDFICTIGNALGLISLAAVHQNIGYVREFRLDTISRFSQALFPTDEEYKEIATATLDQLNTRGYIYMREIVGIAGIYYNDSHTANVITSDYAYIENTRTIYEAVRQIRAYLLTELNGSRDFDPSTGKLAIDDIAYLEELGSKGLTQMLKDSELSGFDFTIPKDQDAASTDKILCTVRLVKRGVSRNFEVTIGFTLSLS